MNRLDVSLQIGRLREILGANVANESWVLFMNNSDVTRQRVFSSEGLGTNDALRRPVVNLSDVQVQAVISEKDLATQFADFVVAAT